MGRKKDIQKGGIWKKGEYPLMVKWALGPGIYIPNGNSTLYLFYKA